MSRQSEGVWKRKDSRGFIIGSVAAGCETLVRPLYAAAQAACIEGGARVTPSAYGVERGCEPPRCPALPAFGAEYIAAKCIIAYQINFSAFLACIFLHIKENSIKDQMHL